MHPYLWYSVLHVRMESCLCVQMPFLSFTFTQALKHKHWLQKYLLWLSILNCSAETFKTSVRTFLQHLDVLPQYMYTVCAVFISLSAQPQIYCCSHLKVQCVKWGRIRDKRLDSRLQCSLAHSRSALPSAKCRWPPRTWHLPWLGQLGVFHEYLARRWRSKP